MTTQRQHLSVQKRDVLGKKVKLLRKNGLLPVRLFSKTEGSIPLTVDTRVFAKMYSQVGETGLIDVMIEGETTARPILVVNVDRHPVNNALLHADLHQVNLKEKITAMIPVEVVGESAAVTAGGVMVLAFDEVEVEALPTDLPEKFVVDISALKTMEDDIKVSSIEYDRTKVTLTTAGQDDVIASVQAPAAEEVVEEVAAPAEPELVKQGATTEEGKTTTDAPAEKKE